MEILQEAIAEETEMAQDLKALPLEDPTIQEHQEQTQQTAHFSFDFLRTPTGAGSIEEYIDHPLNADSSRGVAQMLRGFTGIAGDLKLAILDIALGFINVLKEKRPVKQENSNPANIINLLKND